jgi:uncharacterized protein
MVLDLRKLLSGECGRIDIDYALTLDGAADMGRSDVTFPESASVKGCITNDAGYMPLSLNVGVDYVGSCARCLKDVKGHFDFTYERTVTAKGTLENVEEDDTDDYLIVRDGKLDIDAQLCEELQMLFPYRLLCSEDCRGLCTKCGKDLNEGDCGCDFKEIDPRFEVLRQLLIEADDSEK